MSPVAAKRLARAKRIVVKIGSALLTDSESGALRDQWLRALIDDVADLRSNGAQMVLVSSGAIALGRGILGLRGNCAHCSRSQTKQGNLHPLHLHSCLRMRNLRNLMAGHKAVHPRPALTCNAMPVRNLWRLAGVSLQP